MTLLASSSRLIIKIGSALITDNGTSINRALIANWVKEIAQLRKAGFEIILVSSGAIACGMQKLHMAKRPKTVRELQACAAVGQMGLVHLYEAAFSDFEVTCAQILLTHEDLADRKRYLNARSTLSTLLELGVVPIINENDTVVTDEIKFGDNDTLGALVANLMDADALIILTDQQGLYTADPRKDPSATLVKEGKAGDPALEKMAGGAGTQYGTGGMITKVIAARRAAKSGAHTIIVNGREKDVLTRITQGEALGTRLLSDQPVLNAKKQWLADHLQLEGSLILDEGAIAALKEGKSLLPIGVTGVKGEFERGAVVACVDKTGHEMARGIVNYASFEANRILRRASADIESLLGYIDAPEMIHRDNLVVS